MSTSPLAALPLRSLLFHFIDMELFSYSEGAVLAEDMASSHILIVFKSGSGHLYTGEQGCLFTPESSFLLSPSTSYQFESSEDSKIEFYRICFHVFHVEDGTAKPFVKPLFADRQELRTYPLAQWADLINQLHIGQTSRDDREAHRQQMHFQTVIAFLLEHNLKFELAASSAQTVEHTIAYMEMNFQDNITVKQLAQMAHVPAWQYTSIFKELTGKKPLDYLTELRINRAKEWLVHTENPLREIAERVGFADEYYFSRRFRLMTGYSPRQYAISMSQNILVKDWIGHEVRIPSQPSRVLYCGESVGDMKMLDIPLVGDQMFCKDTPISEEEATRLSPDLIIFDHSDEKLYAKISQIAPTLTYNSRGSLDARLMMLGEWFGKKKEAQQWLLRHNSSTSFMWLQLREFVGPEETASVFVFHRGKRLFVMGNIGLSSILYHPKGFRPAGKIQEVIRSGRPYKEITARTIHHYAGDRVFMILPESPESRSAMEELMSSALWRNLPAVKNGYSYLLNEQDWNYEDAATREKLLSLLPELLTQTS